MATVTRLPFDLSQVEFPNEPSIPEKEITERRRFRTIWISDVHLGTRGCNAEMLIDFLDHVDSEQLYLVGDIIDGWRLKKKFYWPASHNDIVWRILKRAKRGTRITYIPGNHARNEQTVHGHLGRDAVDDHHDRRRDQQAKRARSSQRADGKTVGIAARFQFGQGNAANGGGGGCR